MAQLPPADTPANALEKENSRQHSTWAEERAGAPADTCHARAPAGSHVSHFHMEVPADSTAAEQGLAVAAAHPLLVAEPAATVATPAEGGLAADGVREDSSARMEDGSADAAAQPELAAAPAATSAAPAVGSLTAAGVLGDSTAQMEDGSADAAAQPEPAAAPADTSAATAPDDLAMAAVLGDGTAPMEQKILEEGAQPELAAVPANTSAVHAEEAKDLAYIPGAQSAQVQAARAPEVAAASGGSVARTSVDVAAASAMAADDLLCTEVLLPEAYDTSSGLQGAPAAPVPSDTPRQADAGTPSRAEDALANASARSAAQRTEAGSEAADDVTTGLGGGQAAAAAHGERATEKTSESAAPPEQASGQISAAAAPAGESAVQSVLQAAGAGDLPAAEAPGREALPEEATVASAQEDAMAASADDASPSIVQDTNDAAGTVASVKAPADGHSPDTCSIELRADSAGAAPAAGDAAIAQGPVLGPASQGQPAHEPAQEDVMPKADTEDVAARPARTAAPDGVPAKDQQHTDAVARPTASADSVDAAEGSMTLQQPAQAGSACKMASAELLCSEVLQETMFDAPAQRRSEAVASASEAAEAGSEVQQERSPSTADDGATAQVPVLLPASHGLPAQEAQQGAESALKQLSQGMSEEQVLNTHALAPEAAQLEQPAAKWSAHAGSAPITRQAQAAESGDGTHAVEPVTESARSPRPIVTERAEAEFRLDGPQLTTQASLSAHAVVEKIDSAHEVSDAPSVPAGGPCMDEPAAEGQPGGRRKAAVAYAAGRPDVSIAVAQQLAESPARMAVRPEAEAVRSAEAPAAPELSVEASHSEGSAQAQAEQDTAHSQQPSACADGVQQTEDAAPAEILLGAQPSPQAAGEHDAQPGQEAGSGQTNAAQQGSPQVAAALLEAGSRISVRSSRPKGAAVMASAEAAAQPQTAAALGRHGESSAAAPSSADAGQGMQLPALSDMTPVPPSRASKASAAAASSVDPREEVKMPCAEEVHSLTN